MFLPTHSGPRFYLVDDLPSDIVKVRVIWYLWNSLIFLPLYFNRPASLHFLSFPVLLPSLFSYSYPCFHPFPSASSWLDKKLDCWEQRVWAPRERAGQGPSLELCPLAGAKPGLFWWLPSSRAPPSADTSIRSPSKRVTGAYLKGSHLRPDQYINHIWTAKHFWAFRIIRCVNKRNRHYCILSLCKSVEDTVYMLWNTHIHGYTHIYH